MTDSELIGDAQFENRNSLRSYPFAEWSSLVDSTGDRLPGGYVVDVHMAVPMHAGEPDSRVRAYMTSIHVSRGMVSACFRSGSSAMSVTVSSGSFVPYVPYRLEKLAGCEDAGGIVTFGNIDFDVAPKTYFMAGDGGAMTAELNPCCIVGTRPPGLREFVDMRSGDRASGDVEISFSGYVDSSTTDGGTLLTLKDGAAYELASECLKSSEENPCGATPISSINGVSPDEDGNIVLWFH